MIKKAFPYRKDLLRGAVAAVLGTTVYAPLTWAQDEEEEVTDLEEVVVTGSRIVRRDMEVNSPLLTIDRQLFEDNAFISVEEALNDLPQFMAGGVGMSSGAVTSLQAANGSANTLESIDYTALGGNKVRIVMTMGGAAAQARRMAGRRRDDDAMKSAR